MKNIKTFNLVFSIGIILLFVHRLTPFTEYFFSFAPLARFTIMPAYLFFFGAGIMSLQNQFGGFSVFLFKYRVILYALILVSLIALGIGIYKGYLYTVIIQDFGSVLLYVSGIFIGSKKLNWYYIKKYYYIVMILGGLVALVSLSTIGSIALRSDTYGSLPYELQYFLWPVYFFILTYPFESNKKYKRIIIFVIILQLFEQIIFQKRLPLVKTVLLITIAFFIIPSSFSKYQIIIRNITVILMSFLVSAILISPFFGNKAMQEAVDSLFERFTSSGSVYNTAVYDARFQAVPIVLANVHKDEELLGKGFGNTLKTRDFWWNRVNTGGQFVGVSTTEIGQLWLYWKGGIMLFLLLNLFFITILFSYKKIRKEPVQFAFWIMVLVQFLFLYGESWVGANQFNLILYGMCAGQLISKDKISTEEFVQFTMSRKKHFIQ